MIIILIRSIILYLLMIISMRLMGKRQIGELQPGELAVTMLISNLAVLPIEDSEIPMLMGITPILILVCFEIALSNIGMKNKRFRKLLSGNPIVIIENGKIDQKALHKLRFTIDDLAEALRGNDVFDINEIAYAVVETNGSLSVMKKFGFQTITAQMAHIDGKTISPPLIIISDGKLISENIEKLNLSTHWVIQKIQKQNLSVKNVFLMTADQEKKAIIIPREKRS